jgi:hypothetical protein
MKLLTFFLLQGLHQKPDSKSYFFPGGKYWKHPYFQTYSVRGGFTFYSGFFILLTRKWVIVMKQGTTAKTVGWPCVLHPVSTITIWRPTSKRHERGSRFSKLLRSVRMEDFSG